GNQKLTLKKDCDGLFAIYEKRCWTALRPGLPSLPLFLDSPLFYPEHKEKRFNFCQTRREGMKEFSSLGLNVKIFADGADKASMLEMYADPRIVGFTTNPTLMRKSGVADYAGFATEILHLIPDRPISFEVFADEFDEMEQQALEIASWSPNVIVKVPITNTRGQVSDDLLERLSAAGVKM